MFFSSFSSRSLASPQLLRSSCLFHSTSFLISLLCLFFSCFAVVVFQGESLFMVPSAIVAAGIFPGDQTFWVGGYNGDSYGGACLASQAPTITERPCDSLFLALCTASNVSV